MEEILEELTLGRPAELSLDKPNNDDGVCTSEFKTCEFGESEYGHDPSDSGFKFKALSLLSGAELMESRSVEPGT